LQVTEHYRRDKQKIAQVHPSTKAQHSKCGFLFKDASGAALATGKFGSG
jgi:hypothetical protein